MDIESTQHIVMAIPLIPVLFGLGIIAVGGAGITAAAKGEEITENIEGTTKNLIPIAIAGTAITLLVTQRGAIRKFFE